MDEILASAGPAFKLEDLLGSEALLQPANPATNSMTVESIKQQFSSQENMVGLRRSSSRSAASFAGDGHPGESNDADDGGEDSGRIRTLERNVSELVARLEAMRARQEEMEAELARERAQTSAALQAAAAAVAAATSSSSPTVTTGSDSSEAEAGPDIGA
ncbi:hypothetical protein HK405_004964 [Cladochytrium tenue]|nr:hypothetical protein HK405_004964 [Cladochytrium tenue]